MNIIEALKIAKAQGKKVRPVGVNWFVVYEKTYFFSGFVTKNESLTMKGKYDLAIIEEILMDWEVVKEKPSKQTQYKIDSMKFQIVRYCNNRSYCSTCRLFGNCINLKNESIAPNVRMLDDWSLKDIVEAYHILKEAGEI